MSAMAKAQKGKAEAFIKEAEGLLSKKSWFSSSKERNAEEAAEVFEKAANAYKVGGLNQDAGNTYTRAAELYRDKISDFNHASKAFNAAGTKPFRFVDKPKQKKRVLQNRYRFVSRSPTQTNRFFFVIYYLIFFFDNRKLLQKEQSRRCGECV